MLKGKTGRKKYNSVSEIIPVKKSKINLLN